MTLTELLEHVRLATVVEDTNVTDAQLTVILNQGIHEVSVATWWPFLEASAAFSAAASTQTYALSTVASDFNYAQALVDDDNDTTIEYLAAGDFFRRVGNDTGNESATADYWTIWEESIYLSPIPSAADTNRYKLYYYKNATELSAGGDTPEWDEAFHWILVEYAKWKLYEREEYYDQAERSFIMFTRYLADMEAYYRKRVQRSPYLYGDGYGWRQGDPNIPSLYRI